MGFFFLTVSNVSVTCVHPLNTCFIYPIIFCISIFFMTVVLLYFYYRVFEIDKTHSIKKILFTNNLK